MEPLPSELFVEVLGFLPAGAVFRARLVSHKWNDIIGNAELLWQRMLLRDFAITEKEDASWMQAYKYRAR